MDANTLAMDACKRIVKEGGGCRNDHLNPCWHRSGTPGKHWGGGDACGFCTAVAALAQDDEAEIEVRNSPTGETLLD